MKSSEYDLVSEWNEKASRSKWEYGDSWKTVVPQSGEPTIADPPKTVIEAAEISLSGHETPHS